MKEADEGKPPYGGLRRDEVGGAIVEAGHKDDDLTVASVEDFWADRWRKGGRMVHNKIIKQGRQSRRGVWRLYGSVQNSWRRGEMF